MTVTSGSILACGEGVEAIAHPNIALSKYWGKRPGPGNYPAVPSLSVTLSGMTSRTWVRFGRDLRADAVWINDQPAEGRPRLRVVEMLSRIRSAAGLPWAAEVRSWNDFPTASGLASSASGFAVLGLAACRAAGLDWSLERISALSRISSASAARSLFGGYVELGAGPEHPTGDELCCARPVAPADHLDLCVLVCLVSEREKELSSTEGMRITAEGSPYYDAWLRTAPELHAQLREALLCKDFETLGTLVERSALAMHASALAAGVAYLSGVSFAVLSRFAPCGVPASRPSPPWMPDRTSRSWFARATRRRPRARSRR